LRNALRLTTLSDKKKLIRLLEWNEGKGGRDGKTGAKKERRKGNEGATKEEKKPT
jgi:hypothetical protein